uniref:DNA-repair protein Xrcc1 N-terminal domain-containing protein n=1 Tax=Anas zonorhyncha TaxID=75864 RepID=A0A8B9VQ22_9AVES
MTPAESRAGENRCGVRMFKEDFLEPAVGQKWDRVRLTCSQPFSRQGQFGLSFLRLRTPSDPQPDPRPALVGVVGVGGVPGGSWQPPSIASSCRRAPTAPSAAARPSAGCCVHRQARSRGRRSSSGAACSSWSRAPNPGAPLPGAPPTSAARPGCCWRRHGAEPKIPKTALRGAAGGWTPQHRVSTDPTGAKTAPKLPPGPRSAHDLGGVPYGDPQLRGMPLRLGEDAPPTPSVPPKMTHGGVKLKPPRDSQPHLPLPTLMGSSSRVPALLGGGRHSLAPPSRAPGAAPRHPGVPLPLSAVCCPPGSSQDVPAPPKRVRRQRARSPPGR